MKKKDGFRFIEGVIVVLVISVLLVITLSQFVLAQEKARDVQRRNDLRSTAKAILSYYNDYSKFPTDIEINNLWGKEFVDKGYVYMKSVPRENYFGKQYCYKISPSGNYFQLFTDLEHDSECVKNLYTCGGNDYCYTEITYAK